MEHANQSRRWTVKVGVAATALLLGTALLADRSDRRKDAVLTAPKPTADFLAMVSKFSIPSDGGASAAASGGNPFGSVGGNSYGSFGSAGAAPVGGRCCYKASADICSATNPACIPPGISCSKSAAGCAGCGGTWCPADAAAAAVSTAAADPVRVAPPRRWSLFSVVGVSATLLSGLALAVVMRSRKRGSNRDYTPL
eukprot:Hpha_TRINITY_DN12863_c0_g1::TRINITY_DN12863_c0_g1_i1::g.24074::m.24074